MYGRSRMTIEIRIATVPGRSTSGFHQPGRHCLNQARSAVRRSACLMEGEVHPTQESFVRRILAHLVRTVLRMDGSVE